MRWSTSSQTVMCSLAPAWAPGTRCPWDQSCFYDSNRHERKERRPTNQLCTLLSEGQMMINECLHIAPDNDNSCSSHTPGTCQNVSQTVSIWVTPRPTITDTKHNTPKRYTLITAITCVVGGCPLLVICCVLFVLLDVAVLFVVGCRLFVCGVCCWFCCVATFFQVVQTQRASTDTLCQYTYRLEALWNYSFYRVSVC